SSFNRPISPRHLHSFPYTTLFRSTYDYPNSIGVFYAGVTEMLGFEPLSDEWKVMGLAAYGQPTFDLSPLIRSNSESYWVDGRRLDRKSTRLNSSHVSISYAVFCLK